MAEHENNNESLKIGIVIPLFNEVLNLPVLVERLESTMAGLVKSGYDFEVVFVEKPTRYVATKECGLALIVGKLRD